MWLLIAAAIRVVGTIVAVSLSIILRSTRFLATNTARRLTERSVMSAVAVLTGSAAGTVVCSVAGLQTVVA